MTSEENPQKEKNDQEEQLMKFKENSNAKIKDAINPMVLKDHCTSI